MGLLTDGTDELLVESDYAGPFTIPPGLISRFAAPLWVLGLFAFVLIGLARRGVWLSLVC